MDLQLFSQERTEQATPKKLQDARKKGQAPRSADLAAGLGLLVAALSLRSLAPRIYEQIAGGMTETFQDLARIDLTADNLSEVLQPQGLVLLKAVLSLLFLLALIGVMTGLLQTGFLFSTKPLAPDFNRLNPISGVQRMFSLKTVVELVKSLIKLAAIGSVVYLNLSSQLPMAGVLAGQAPAAGIVTVVDMAGSVLLHAGFALTAIGALDFSYQRWEFQKEQRMTKQEVKEEQKQTDGNPELKAKQKQRQREMARRRKALKDVALANVVITNPTHFAVAIRFDPAVDAVPVVVAKGTDLLAQRIKAIARKHEIPAVENRPLARTLYATVDIGRSIPPELYQAVAEVLAFVFSLRRQERHQQAR